MDIQAYPAHLGDPAAKRFEAMSYLPQMSAEDIRKQLTYAASKGNDMVIEHTAPAYVDRTYWHMWKLPFFGERDIDVILKEVDACAKANPGDHIRICAIDKVKQTMDFSLVVKRAKA